MAEREFLSVADYERAAEQRLEPGVFGYVAGGAADERALRENIAAFRRWQLRPRILVDVGHVSTATTVLRETVSMPLLVAPTAFHRVVHPEGEVGTARAAADAGTVMCISTLSSASPAEIGAMVPEGKRWFQLYWPRDRQFTRELLAAVADAGFTALVLTVDLPVPGLRERELRSAFSLPMELPLPNLAAHLPSGEFHAAIASVVDPTLTWRDLEWLRSVCELPLILKGVLTAEDALLACEHGAAGIVVSNHGGRQLDSVAAGLDVLEEVVEAVGGRAEVFVDGGIRRGTDVVTALALGARAVMAGRAVLYGLAVDGANGVLRVLELLRAEIELTLKLLGCASPDDVTRAHVRRVERAWP